MSDALLKYLFVLFAITQACLVSGLTAYIFFYYLPKKRKDLTVIRRHVIVISISYLCLTLATMKTAIINLYPIGDIWYWAVITAYIFGDIGLLHMLKHVAKKRKLEEDARE